MTDPATMTAPPGGYHTLNAYIGVRGAKEVLEFYIDSICQTAESVTCWRCRQAPGQESILLTRRLGSAQ